MEIDFDWDPFKAEQNRRKHGVTFEEGQSVFDDPMAISFVDPDHSPIEDRELILGYSTTGRLIIVSYTHRGPIARIINARTATRRERSDYERRRRR
jgi:uncharacterized DUF497 family protein